MLGSGRPFLVEIQNARHVPSEALVKEIEININNLNTQLVRGLPNSILKVFFFLYIFNKKHVLYHRFWLKILKW